MAAPHTALRARTGCTVVLYTKKARIVASHTPTPTQLTAPQPVSGSTVHVAHDYGETQGLHLVECASNNAMGQGGDFSLQVKLDRSAEAFLSEISDDTWVDISYEKDGVSWHCMRGIVDDVRVSFAVSGTGATVTTATVSGRSFQKAYETTPIFFHPLMLDNNFVALIHATKTGLIDGPPQQNVQTVLQDLFAYIGTCSDTPRANWVLPPTMPLSKATTKDVKPSTLYQAVLFDTYLVDDNRSGLLQNKSCYGANTQFDGGNNVWQLAESYSDPMFCELFTELLPAPGANTQPTQQLAAQPQLQKGLSVRDSAMVVVTRDKPFLLSSKDIQRPVGKASSYYLLPLTVAFLDELTELSIGHTGAERFNSFNVSLDVTMTNFGNLNVPLWSPQDMALHGMRSMQGNSRYSSRNPQGPYFTSMRSMLRDFYCLNARMLSGQMTLANAHPEIRVGGNIQVHSRGAVNQREYLEAYVEGVAHSWRYNQLRTNVTFTRGFYGGAHKQAQRLADQASLYTEAFLKA